MLFSFNRSCSRSGNKVGRSEPTRIACIRSIPYLRVSWCRKGQNVTYEGVLAFHVLIDGSSAEFGKRDVDATLDCQLRYSRVEILFPTNKRR